MSNLQTINVFMWTINALLSLYIAASMESIVYILVWSVLALGCTAASVTTGSMRRWEGW